MTLEGTEYLIIIAMFVGGILLASLLSGRMRFAVELLVIMAISNFGLIYLILEIQPTTFEEVAVITSLAIMMMGVLILRFNVLFKDPYNKLTDYQMKVVKKRDLTILSDDENESASGVSGTMQLAVYFEKKAREITSGLISSLVDTHSRLTETSRILINQTDQLNKNSIDLTGDVDTILQSVVVLNDLSDQLQNELDTFQNDISLRFEQISGILQNTDRISDQTNLIAVNAAIEAAHSASSTDSFGLVADSIQQLSSRSRNSTDKLIISIRSLQEEIVGKINFVLNRLRKYEDAIFTIAEVSNNSSKYSREQKELVENINANVVSMRDRINRTKSKYDGYII